MALCLLYSCLWIAVFFASSSDGVKEGPGQGQGRLLAKTVCPDLKEKLTKILESLQLFPTVLNFIVIGYATGMYFIEPLLVRRFRYGVGSIILAHVQVLCGIGTESTYAIRFDSLFDADTEVSSGIKRNIKLSGFGVFDRMLVFVIFEGDIIFKQTDGDKKEFRLPRYFKYGSSHVQVAPKISGNGLVWMQHQNDFVLINMARIISTGTTEGLLHRVDSKHGISFPSLNEAGEVLIFVDYDHTVGVFKVECHPNGEIVVEKRLKIEGHRVVANALLLKNNVVTIVTDQKIFL